MKKTIKNILRLLLILSALVGVYLLFMTFTDYKPEEVIILEKTIDQSKTIATELSVTTFNIGYASLDESTDFFMDGGTESRAKSELQVHLNLEGISNIMDDISSDIYLLQEVDLKAKRSYKINQVDYLLEKHSTYEGIFATNYKVPFVPVPLYKPHGQVHSGLLTLSEFKTTSNTRYQFPGEEAWPRQLALLDRCFIESRYQYGDKELVIVNLHMSAYDSGGFMRQGQSKYLSDYLQKEYDQGNYIIVGGDFNQEIPGTNADDFNTVDKPSWLQPMREPFDNYTWHCDPNVPTNRALDQAYVEGTSYICNIDGFLVSDNITVEEVIVHDLKFKNSDHNPVTIKCTLKNP